jgi:LPS-assembly lipoprotein
MSSSDGLSSTARRRGLALAAALMGSAAAGCGFQLRQVPALSFGSIALVGFAPRSPLAEELRQALSQRVRVVEAPARADVVLQSLGDTRERSVVAQTSAAQVRELQLRLRFHFRAQTPGGKELLPAAILLLSRDMSYSETAALAKELEETELFREMQSDVVLQVTRRLSAIRL